MEHRDPLQMAIGEDELDEEELRAQKALEDKEKRRHLCRAIFWGQVLSFIVALSALVTKFIVDVYNVSAPALQTACGYALIAMFSCVLCGGITTFRDQKWKMIGSLALVAVADSQADFTGNLAYTYGVSIASVGMLSSFTIPCVMLLSCCFLKVKYKGKHYLGTGIALLGLVFVVMADIKAAQDQANSGDVNNGTAPSDDATSFGTVTGDMLIIVGSALYAISNVATEAFVKQRNLFEFLFWLGSFGFIITIIQFAILESGDGVANAKHPNVVWLLFIAYAICFFGIYFGAGRYLAIFDAVLFNLSLLTTDVWGLLIGFFIFGEIIGPLKIVGFFAVVIGVVVYNLEAPERPAIPIKIVDDVDDAERILIDRTEDQMDER